MARLFNKLTGALPGPILRTRLKDTQLQTEIQKALEEADEVDGKLLAMEMEWSGKKLMGQVIKDMAATCQQFCEIIRQANKIQGAIKGVMALP